MLLTLELLFKFESGCVWLTVHYIWRMIYCVVLHFVIINVNCLCLRQSQLAGDMMFSTCPFVRPSVRPSIRSCVTNLVHMIFWKWMNQFCCKLAQMVNGATGWNGRLWGQEVKGQGHPTPKLDLETWRRHDTRPLPRCLLYIYLLFIYTHWWICCFRC